MGTESASKSSSSSSGSSGRSSSNDFTPTHSEKSRSTSSSSDRDKTPRKHSSVGSSPSPSSRSSASTNRSDSFVDQFDMAKIDEEKSSAAAHMMNDFKLRKYVGILPRPGYYAIRVESKPGHLLVHFRDVEKERGLFDQVFGKGSLRDIKAVPAAILYDFDKKVLGMFVLWTRYRSSRRLEPQDLFDAQITREDRLRAIDTMLQLLFFAEKYVLDEFQDEVLRLLIDACKEEDMILDSSHVRQCLNHTSQASTTRFFCRDLLAFHRQELQREEIQNVKKVASASDLADNHEGVLTDLLDQLGGSEYRTPEKRLSDPREAPECTYHQHGSQKPCPYMSSDYSNIRRNLQRIKYLSRRNGSEPRLET